MALLFPKDQLPRTRRRVMMHVIDAGDKCGIGMEPGEQHVRFRCSRCNAETDWESMPSVTAARRGIPCDNCNPKPKDKFMKTPDTKDAQGTEDENGDKMYTMHYRGFHVVFSEPLTPDEEVVFKQLLDKRRDKK